jgi:enamine deaminase RidA (YjgF/YER057c/UK114 family)
MPHMLESARSSLDRIDKMTVVLAGAGDYDEMNGMARVLPGRPAGPHLRIAAQNGHGVEIECIALAGNRPF